MGKRKPLGDKDAMDAENIDPISLKSSTSSKRKRSDADDDENGNENNENQEPITTSSKVSKPLKASRIAMKTITSCIPTTQSKPLPSLTLPAKPAGRSPQSSPSKSISKPFARRSNVNKARPEPASRKGVSRPFSITTALSGKSQKTASSTAPAPKIEMPASWCFDIHVDTEEEEMTNLMQHSTGVLDISDDDAGVSSKRARGSSLRGKENVPPSELGLNLASTASQRESPAATARKSVMMEESRAPLGELNAADYYGADCHAFSYAVVYDNNEEQDAENTPKPTIPRSTRPTHTSKLSSVSSISSLLESTVPPKHESEPELEETNKPEIDIWESESAAEEAAQD